jgi:hypothetical protein
MEAFRIWFHSNITSEPPSQDRLRSPFQKKQAALLIALGDALHKWPGAEECGSSVLLDLPGAKGRALAELRTLERWLRRQPPSLRGQPLVVTAPRGVFPVRPEKTVSLMVEDTQTREGMPAKLTVELMPRTAKTGVLFPDREMLFVERDEKWDTALERAAAGFADRFAEFDVRWRVALRDTARSVKLAALTGNSGGGAFQYVLDCTFRNVDPLPGVVFAASNGKNGEWEAIGAFLPKLTAAARKARPVIHTVVVSAEQNLDGIRDAQEPVRHGDTEYLFDKEGEGGSPFGRLAIVRAKNFAEGRERATVPAAHRWALRDEMSVLEPPPDSWEIHREQFIGKITARVDAMESGFLLVTGEMGRGKTVAMGQLVRAWRNEDRSPVCYFLPKETVISQRPGEIARHLLLQLAIKHNFQEPADWSSRFRPDQYADRLEALLLLLSPRLIEAGRKEIIVIEAADQAVLDGHDDLIPSVLRSPPPGVVWLVSSRPRSAPAVSDRKRIETLDFLSLVDDRADARQLLEKRGTALNPPLQPALINAICTAATPPVMFSLDWAFRQLEAPKVSLAESDVFASLRVAPEIWLREPRRLVCEDLGWLLKAAEERGVPRSDARRWLLLTALGEGLSRDLLGGLGIFPEHARIVFQLAANFFKRSGDYALRHPGYARAIRGEEIPREEIGEGLVDALELEEGAMASAHELIGKACLAKWDNNKTPPLASAYALRSVCGHLRGAGMGAEMNRLLMETPEFLFRRGETGGMAALADDFPRPGEALDLGLSEAQAKAIDAVREVIRARGHFVETE